MSKKLPHEQIVKIKLGDSQLRQNLTVAMHTLQKNRLNVINAKFKNWQGLRDKAKKAKNNELSTFVKRDEYLNRLDIIMNRRFKNNPLLIGNAGVGKTAIVEGYAMMLEKKGSDLTILSLNLTSMLAGTRYRGDFEERFDKFVKEIACKNNVVIFIDEIHTIMGAGNAQGSLDAANILKPALARGEVQCIGATTITEYRKSIEKDAVKRVYERFDAIT